MASIYNPYVPLNERLWRFVDRRGPGECWPWVGCVNPSTGYARIRRHGARTGAHRVAYELHHRVRLLPHITIDHLCANRICMNPAHLEPVSRGENARRYMLSRTHCKHGHEFVPTNTRYDRNGRRVCRTCARRHSRMSAARCGGGQ